MQGIGKSESGLCLEFMWHYFFGEARDARFKDATRLCPTKRDLCLLHCGVQELQTVQFHWTCNGNTCTETLENVRDGSCL